MTNNIHELTINGFKGFTNETAISFSDLTVLAGGNSVGKSTIIQALLLSRLQTANADTTGNHDILTLRN